MYGAKKIKHYCLDCKKLISKFGLRCFSCACKNKMKPITPSLDVLISTVNKIGYCATGRLYGVTDNTIRNWIKRSIQRSAQNV